MLTRRELTMTPAERRAVLGPPELYEVGRNRGHDDSVISPEHSERAIDHMRRHGVDWDAAVRATRRPDRYQRADDEPDGTDDADGPVTHTTVSGLSWTAPSRKAVEAYVQRTGCSFQQGICDMASLAARSQAEAAVRGTGA